MTEFGPHHEASKERSCFPVSQESITSVNQEIQTKFGGDPEKFANSEMEIIKRSNPRLGDHIGRSFAWYQEIVRDANINAFLDGATYVHRILRQQGDLPPLPEDTGDVIRQEEEAYEQISDSSNKTLGETLSSESTFVHAKELTSQDLGKALTDMIDRHPNKPDFAVGGEITYLAIKNANEKLKEIDNQVTKSSANLDEEFSVLMNDSTERTKHASQEDINKKFAAIIGQPRKDGGPNKE